MIATAEPKLCKLMANFSKLGAAAHFTPAIRLDFTYAR